MYYEEEFINNVLMFRTSPNGAWRQVSITEMGQRILDLQTRVSELEGQLEACSEYVNSLG